MAIAKSTPPAERFWAKVEKTDSCWPWRAGVNKEYGEFNFGNNWMRQAHRVAWELTHGPIPDGLCVLHKCDVPLCVNPDHLFLGTKLDNVRDMIAKGRAYRRPRQTHCHNGHVFSGVDSKGRHVCRTCRNDWQRVRRPSRALAVVVR
jgi:hypothetical protein